MPTPKKSSEPTMQVMVTVDRRYRDQLDNVERQLKAAGLDVAERSELGGVIIGEVATANLSKLHGLESVASVEEEPTMRAYR